MRTSFRFSIRCLVVLLVANAAPCTCLAQAQQSGLVEAAQQPRWRPPTNHVVPASGQGLLQEPAPRLVFDLQEEVAADAILEGTEDQGVSDPTQSRELVPEVFRVNLSMTNVGTGKLPTPPENNFDDQVWLPDGIARGAAFQCVHWRASQLQYNPLYFQDVPLERHGHRCAGCFQPLVSGAKFYSTIAIYPYLRTLRRPQECIYSLGHYRPGTPAPCLKQHIPYDKRAAAVETLSLATFFWAMPL